MNLSLIIPAFEEAESLALLHKQITDVLHDSSLSYEIIMVDDGSRDNTWEVISKLHDNDQRIKAIKFQRNYGKAAALNEGFRLAKGNVVITFDADLQDDPAEIPALYKMIVEEEFDLVSGWKKKRHDPISKRLPSKLYNKVLRMMSGIKLHDMNCGLKAYKNEVVKHIEVYGEMHRFIPVIVKRAGYIRIGEKIVHHRKRQYGKSKYGIERYMRGFLDLLSIMFVTRFARKPMHLFGLLGSLMFLVGFVILVYLTVTKYVYGIYHMTERPLFYFGLLTVILGTQLFLTGFVAELVSRNAPDRNQYLIDKSIPEN